MFYTDWYITSILIINLVRSLTSDALNASSETNAPVRTPLPANGSCGVQRFSWPPERPTSCCLELPCPAGQVLAKDERNTFNTDCPKCRTNDSCRELDDGSVCRNFFNSTSVFICACDASRGFTQNRLAFPIGCTKHCTFVDANSYCDIRNDVKPRRGTCKCRKETTLNENGRCEPDPAPIIRKVRQVAVADWGDQSIWMDGVPTFPDYEIGKAKKATVSPVLSQDFEDRGKISDRMPRKNNATVIFFTTHNSTNNSSIQPRAKPMLGIVEGDRTSLGYMIAAHRMRTNGSTSTFATPTPVISNTSHDLPLTPGALAVAVESHEAVLLPGGLDNSIHLTESQSKPESGTVASGTHFASDDSEAQLDTSLNIIVKASRRKLQTERPTTSGTWDVTHPSSTSSSTTAISSSTLPPSPSVSLAASMSQLSATPARNNTPSWLNTLLSTYTISLYPKKVTGSTPFPTRKAVIFTAAPGKKHSTRNLKPKGNTASQSSTTLEESVLESTTTPMAAESSVSPYIDTTVRASLMTGFELSVSHHNSFINATVTSGSKNAIQKNETATLKAATNLDSTLPVLSTNIPTSSRQTPRVSTAESVASSDLKTPLTQPTVIFSVKQPSSKARTDGTTVSKPTSSQSTKSKTSQESTTNSAESTSPTFILERETIQKTASASSTAPVVSSVNTFTMASSQESTRIVKNNRTRQTTKNPSLDIDTVASTTTTILTTKKIRPPTQKGMILDQVLQGMLTSTEAPSVSLSSTSELTTKHTVTTAERASRTRKATLPYDIGRYDPYGQDSGRMKVKLSGNGRFGGVLRITTPSVTESQKIDTLITSTTTKLRGLTPLSSVATTTTSATTIPPIARPTKDTSASSRDVSIDHTNASRYSAPDLSFLQNPELSKVEMRDQLIKLLLSLSATTTPPPTTTSATTTTTVQPFDLSFLSDKGLSAADMQERLLPLLLQLRFQMIPSKERTSVVPVASEYVSSESTQTSISTTQIKDVPLTSVRRLKHTIPWRSTTTESPLMTHRPTTYPQKNRTVSIFNALFSGLGALMPRPQPTQINTTHAATHTDSSAPTVRLTPKILQNATTNAVPANATISFTTGKALAETATMPSLDDTSTFAREIPVPSFSQIFGGLKSIFGSIFGVDKSTRPSDSLDVQDGQNALAYGQLKTNNGKLDLSDPETQKKLAFILQQKDESATSGSAKTGLLKPHSSLSSSKQFNFANPSEQQSFVKFLKTFDKYKPAQSKVSDNTSSLFPKPPPLPSSELTASTSTTASPETTMPAATTMTPTNRPAPGRPEHGMQIPVDALSPEAWNLINTMQKPGYYNVTKEQLAALQPILQQLRIQQTGASADLSALPSNQPNAVFNQWPMYTPNSWTGGDPYASFVPPAEERPINQEKSVDEPTTASPSQTDRSPDVSTTSVNINTATVGQQKIGFVSLPKSLNSETGEKNSVFEAPVVKEPSQPSYSAVLKDKVQCDVDCAAQDRNSYCDRLSGSCTCRLGYHSSMLEGNICTRTILSLCSGDEDCRSGGDMNTECAFNGQNRFCTCSNGYLADDNGVCSPMFAAKCSGTCDVPNSVCDPIRSICRCPAGYAWFKDPFTGQAVCKAALGGQVPCRKDQDLCPIYTPRGKCMNNAICGCEDGYIPDSWFKNQSERTSCIDVLSAKCDGSSDCTTADKNTLCDRKLRMCICKPGFRPDPLHISACVPEL